MKKSIFAVCDLEASYAYNLMEAIDERQGMSFEVQAFTNVESLISYARERHIEPVYYTHLRSSRTAVNPCREWLHSSRTLASPCREWRRSQPQ